MATYRFIMPYLKDFLLQRTIIAHYQLAIPYQQLVHKCVSLLLLPMLLDVSYNLCSFLVLYLDVLDSLKELMVSWGEQNHG